MANQGIDPAMMQAAQAVQQQAIVQQFVHKISTVCWDKCDVRADAKLSGSNAQCIQNCAGRYLDVSKFVSTRFSSMLERQ